MDADIVITTKGVVSLVVDDEELLDSSEADVCDLFKRLVECRGQKLSFKMLQKDVRGEVRKAVMRLRDKLNPSRDRASTSQLWQEILPDNADADEALLCLKKSGKSIIELIIRSNNGRVLIDGLEPELAGITPLSIDQLDKRTAFIGRETAVQEILQFIETSRFITLKGIGGIGKTRLAVHIANQLHDRFRHGVHMVELGLIRAPEQIPSSLATVLNVKLAPTKRPIESLALSIGHLEMLLILDNCEHLATKCGAMVVSLLERCPNLRILTTSSRILGSGTETVYEVAPMALPDVSGFDIVDQVNGTEATQLFARRARARTPSFSVTKYNADVIIEICRQLQGIPLFIEIAAAQISGGLEQILEQLAICGFGQLTGTDGSAPFRHRSYRALMDWASHIVGETHRTLLNRLSVFRGGFSIATAQKVCALPPISEEAVHGLLLDVVDSSLIYPADELTRRFMMLEPMRRYSDEGLLSSGEHDKLRDMHAIWCLSLAVECRKQILASSNGAAVQQLDLESSNIQAALEWTLQGNGEQRLGCKLALSLTPWWNQTGRYSEGSKWLQLAVRAYEGPVCVEQLTMMNAIGAMSARLGAFANAKSWFGRVRDLARQNVEHQSYVAHALNNLGNVARNQKEYRKAERLYNQSLEIWSNLDDEPSILEVTNNKSIILWNQGFLEDAYGQFASIAKRAFKLSESDAYEPDSGEKLKLLKVRRLALTNLASLASRQARFSEALQCLDELLPSVRSSGNKVEEGLVLLSLGCLYTETQEWTNARSALLEALEIKNSIGEPDGIAHTLEAIADLLAIQAQFHQSVMLWSAARCLRRRIGSPLAEDQRQTRIRNLREVILTIGRDNFTQAYALGQQLGLPAAVDAARRFLTHFANEHKA